MGMDNGSSDVQQSPTIQHFLDGTLLPGNRPDLCRFMGWAQKEAPSFSSRAPEYLLMYGAAKG